ncbi:MAG: hypothetical protein JXL84_13905 [Deltaproteobacteria bacterium]|nr:hypothetical protein [Deltaproteobacteria bacterium]
MFLPQSMIRREHIKRAIDGISKRNPEIGYSLDEMLGMGLIDVAPEAEQDLDRENYFFLFEGEKVLVNRVLFFDEGTVPIEQGLLIKYGELLKRHELEEKGAAVDFRKAFREIHEAGLRLVVTYEIDRAVSRIKKRLEQSKGDGESGKAEKFSKGLIRLLEEVKEDHGPPKIEESGTDPFYLYRGIVDIATPAYFTVFPLSMGTLMQVADINVEFFHVRFVLNCLIRGLEKNLLVCVAENSIAGLIYLTLKEQFLRRDLEIKYLATLRGKTWHPAEGSPKALKGVGTFLVAGTWLLLKNELPAVKDIVLDAEVGARQFYESVGFEPRGLSGYVLRTPKAYLLKAILDMTRHCLDLKEDVIKQIRELIRKQVKWLRAKGRTEKHAAQRTAAIACIRECLRPGGRREFAEAALENLTRYGKKIPESQELIRFATEQGPDQVKAYVHATGGNR